MRSPVTPLRRRTMRSVALVVLCVVVTVACREPVTVPGAAERAFVGALIPHHHLGQELNGTAAWSAEDVRLRGLVFEMGGYHARELALMERWAGDWDVPLAETFPGHLDRSRVDALTGLTGVDFDTEWLVLMIEHHDGAVALADTQLRDGRMDEARDLAKEVRKVQSDELAKMRTLLAELCASSPDALGCRSAR